MNENSNIRRIDELGRIVIPKDIRKKLHIKNNEPLEIFIDNDEIRIKKYSYLEDALDYIYYLVDIGNRTTSNSYIVTDRDNVLASNITEFKNKQISQTLEAFIDAGKNISDEYYELQVTPEQTLKGYFNIYQIIIDNDKSGLIIEYNTSEHISSVNIVKIFVQLLENKLNNY